MMDIIATHITDFKYITRKSKEQLIEQWEEKQKIWDNIEAGQHCFYSNVYQDQFHHEVLEVYPEERKLVLLDYSMSHDEGEGKRTTKRMLPNQDLFADSLEQLKEQFEFPKRTVF